MSVFSIVSDGGLPKSSTVRGMRAVAGFILDLKKGSELKAKKGVLPLHSHKGIMFSKLFFFKYIK